MTARARLLFLLLGLIMVALTVTLYVSYGRWSVEVEKAHAAIREAAEAQRKGLEVAPILEIAGRKVTRRVAGNTIELHGLSCSIAQELDAVRDDGRFRSGRIRASVESCVPGGANDPVPILRIVLPEGR